jgi:hypothetical protein
MAQGFEDELECVIRWNWRGGRARSHRTVETKILQFKKKKNIYIYIIVFL